MNRTEYDAVNALSYSGMKALMVSPAHYRHWLTNKPEDTKALRIGRAVHCAALQPEVFAVSYAQAPDVDRRTKDGKAAYQFAEEDAVARRRNLLAFDEFNLAIAVADAAKPYLPEGVAETPIVGTSVKTPIKGIPDLISADGWIYDLKTTESVAERDLIRTILTYGYHIQAAHYINLARTVRDEVKGFKLVFVEKEGLQAVRVVQLTGEWLEAGAKRCDEMYVTYDSCVSTGEWPEPMRQGDLVLDTMPGSKKAPAATLTF